VNEVITDVSTYFDSSETNIEVNLEPKEPVTKRHGKKTG
jgi:hypothetical protein